MICRVCLVLAALCGAAAQALASPPGAKLSAAVESALAAAGHGGQLAVWIALTDKGPLEVQKADLPWSLVSQRSIARRLKTLPPDRAVDRRDLPVFGTYVDEIAARVVRVRQRSKWLDSVSVVATREQIEALASLPFVRRIDLVARCGSRRREAPRVPRPDGSSRRGAADHGRAPRASATPDYGPSFAQLQQIRVTDLYGMDFIGRGVLVGHFDDGIRLRSHQAFDSLHVLAQHDFVDHDPDPAPSPTDTTGAGNHGTSTLSVLAGYAPGQLIGAAYGATYVLARTEDSGSETRREEDNWIAAVEWAESLGVDIVSSSLGYDSFERPYFQSWQDMDGNTTPITRAADLAAARGVLVVNAIGNNGSNTLHNTMLAPADGDSVLAVGGVIEDGTRNFSSSIGPTNSTPARIKPDVMARGANVRIAGTGSTSEYTWGSGTSYACPLVAGAAALLLSARPATTAAQIRDALRETASRAATPDNFYGWGIVNARAALDWIDGHTPPPPPAAYRLEPNFPNPFNAGTTLRYALPERAFATLRVYDTAGRFIRTLVHEAQNASLLAVPWDGKDRDGREVPSGVYYYRLRAEGIPSGHVYIAERKMVLVR
jgi:subtilisin family serine protease